MHQIKNHSVWRIKYIGSAVVDFKKIPKNWAEKVFEELYDNNDYHTKKTTEEQDIVKAIYKLGYGVRAS